MTMKLNLIHRLGSLTNGFGMILIIRLLAQIDTIAMKMRLLLLTTFDEYRLYSHLILL